MESDAQCFLCCIQLSSVLFIGSLLSHFAVDSVWWFDGATALIIALLVGRESFNAVRKCAPGPTSTAAAAVMRTTAGNMRWLRKRQRGRQ